MPVKYSFGTGDVITNHLADANKDVKVTVNSASYRLANPEPKLHEAKFEKTNTVSETFKMFAPDSETSKNVKAPVIALARGSYNGPKSTLDGYIGLKPHKNIYDMVDGTIDGGFIASLIKDNLIYKPIFSIIPRKSIKFGGWDAEVLDQGSEPFWAKSINSETFAVSGDITYPVTGVISNMNIQFDPQFEYITLDYVQFARAKVALQRIYELYYDF